RLRQFVAIVIAVFLIATSVAFLISTPLQGVISRPLLKLSQTARTVSEEKDYTLRAQRHGEDEVGVLIDSFNEMLAQIQSAIWSYRRRGSPRSAPIRRRAIFFRS